MKKLLAGMLSAAVVMSTLPVTAAAVTYSDMDGHWAREQVESFSELGIVQGYNGAFRPDDGITRGEMAVILDRMMDYQAAAQNTFTDLGDDFYTDAVLKANASGVMLGDGGRVRPTAPITRQEAAVMLYRALGLEGSGSLSQFSDRNQVASWAADAVGAMAQRGYIQGSSGAFRPGSSITRAEVVTILDRVVQKLVSAGESVTGNVSGDVVVRGPGATLSNMTITGDLIIAEGVAEGDVTLNNVTITGRTIIRGGGEHSILMNNVRANGGIVVNRLDGRVRIVTSGNCSVSLTVLQTGAILVGDGFQTVEIPADMAAGQTVELSGAIGRLVNHCTGVTIRAEGRIGTVEATVPTAITGSNIRVDNAQGSGAVTVNNRPVTTGATRPTGGSSGGGGGNGGSGRPTPPATTYRITLDTTTLSLKSGDTQTLRATVTVPEGVNSGVYWISSDTSVVTVGETTGVITAVRAGTATVTAAIDANRSYTADCAVTVTAADTPKPPETPETPVNPGWNEAAETDPRFAEGYPLCTTYDDNGVNRVEIKVKVPTASGDNPVDVYMVVNQMNSRWSASVSDVLHGHAGYDEDGHDGMIWVDAAPCLRLTDGEEHSLRTDVGITGDSDIRVDFVLVDRSGTSERVTEVLYGKEMTAELDNNPPRIVSAYINEARDAIYLHIDDTMDETSVPAPSAFALTGAEGAAVTGVELTPVADRPGWRTRYYVRLAVSGITSGADLRALKVAYTRPESNPLQDTATTPNPVANGSWTVKDAAVSLADENVYVSAHGQYIHFQTTNSFYFPHAADFTVSVNGTEIPYEQDYSWTNSGASFDAWLKAESGSFRPGDRVTVTCTPAEGMLNYAMDPANSFSGSGTAASGSISMESAVYDSAKNELIVSFSGENMDPDSVQGCSFQLIAPDGTRYWLRGQSFSDWEERDTAIRFHLEDLPVVPAAGWKLTYDVQHSDAAAHEIVTALSGEPMETQSPISITIQ